MSYDPSKRGPADRGFISWQPPDISYVKAKAHILCPSATLEEIDNALGHCKAAVSPSEGRDRLMECLQRRLS